MLPSGSRAVLSFARIDSRNIGPKERAAFECANSVMIWGADNSRKPRGSMRPLAPTLWASQS
eukprot:12576730-Alexandrium_andersonii.AAC.1